MLKLMIITEGNYLCYWSAGHLPSLFRLKAVNHVSSVCNINLSKSIETWPQLKDLFLRLNAAGYSTAGDSCA